MLLLPIRHEKMQGRRWPVITVAVIALNPSDQAPCMRVERRLVCAARASIGTLRRGDAGGVDACTTRVLVHAD